MVMEKLCSDMGLIAISASHTVGLFADKRHLEKRSRSDVSAPAEIEVKGRGFLKSFATNTIVFGIDCLSCANSLAFRSRRKAEASNRAAGRDRTGLLLKKMAGPASPHMPAPARAPMLVAVEICRKNLDLLNPWTFGERGAA